MCTVSMVINDWMQPGSPNHVTWPTIQRDPELALQMLEVIKRLEAIDKKLGLMEQCKVAEPQKRGLKKKLRRIARGKHA